MTQQELSKEKKQTRDKLIKESNGKPILSLFIITFVMIIISVIYTLIAMIVSEIIAVVGAPAPLLIIGVPSIFLFWLLYYAMYFIEPYILEEIYSTSSTVWFNVFGFVWVNIWLVGLLGGISKLFEWNWFIEYPIDIFVPHINDFFTYMPAISNELATSLAFVCLSASNLWIFISFAKRFRLQACFNCKIAYVANFNTKCLSSKTRAEFSESSGYWTTRNASVTGGGIPEATISYDTYVPGSTKFNGIYKYENNVSTYTCPICGKTKYEHWAGAERIL